ncbi:MAG: dihydrofolate reductase [Proteobacteria bacterium]|nr:dihydrofolate reductase [Pseudomonadota bacterium]
MNAQPVHIVLVAAIGENGVIGTDGQLPWRLKSDLQHFKRVTSGRPVVMGRKTFASIGRPLPNRTNIVMTRDLQFAAPGATLATSLDAALAIARDDARRRGIYEIMIIGGGDVFEATMAMADRLEITHVHASPKGDVVFPAIDGKVWRETMRQHYDAGPDDDASFDTVTYERR